jgi:hypothetical protein
MIRPLIAEATSTNVTARRAGRRLRLDASDAAFVMLLALGATLVLIETGDLSFFGDEWDFLLDRRGLSADVLLRPHGPHLSLIPILVYKLLLKVFGAGSYLPFRLLTALDLVIVAAALGWVCRQRWGKWWGLAPVLLVVTLGPGAITLLWPFQVGYALALTAGIVSLVAIDRGGRRWDAVACLALIVSLASGSQGIGFVVGGAVMLALRRQWRRGWVVAVPALLYLLWYLKYGSSAETDLGLWSSSLSYVLHSLGSTLSGILGLGPFTTAAITVSPPDDTNGVPLALAAIALLVTALVRGWRPPPLFWGTLAALVAIWGAASLSNIHMLRPPNDRRYLWVNAVLALICICTAVPRPRFGRAGAAVAFVALAILSATNASHFSDTRTFLQTSDVASRAELGALLIVRDNVPSKFAPAPPGPPGLIENVTAGPFFSAVDSFGTTADSVTALQHQDEATRQLADGVLLRGSVTGLSGAPVNLAPAAAPPQLLSGSAHASGSCITVGATEIAVSLAPDAYALKAPPGAPLSVKLGRFGSVYGLPLGVVPAGQTAYTAVLRDRAPQVPWRALLTGAGGSVCALTRP